jgi:hypothetical protein
MSLDPSEKILLHRIASEVSELHKEWPEFKAAVLALERQQREHERRIIRLEGTLTTGLAPPSLPPPLPPMRDKENSWNDVDVEWQQAREKLRSQAKDPKNPLDSIRAKALARQAIDEANRLAELDTWRKIKGIVPRAGSVALDVLIKAAVGAGIVEAWHLLSKR